MKLRFKSYLGGYRPLPIKEPPIHKFILKLIFFKDFNVAYIKLEWLVVAHNVIHTTARDKVKISAYLVLLLLLHNAKRPNTRKKVCIAPPSPQRSSSTAVFFCITCIVWQLRAHFPKGNFSHLCLEVERIKQKVRCQTIFSERRGFLQPPPPTEQERIH